MSSLSIKKLKLWDYRCFDTVDINFHERLTVLVAPNGAGKSAVLDAIAIAFGPYLGAFDEAVGRHFKFSDIRMLRVRETTSNEMEYCPNGVRLEAFGFIPNNTPGAFQRAQTKWARALSGPSKAKTTIKEAKELIDFGKRLQNAVRTPNRNTVLPLLAYYGTGRLWQQKKLTVSKKIHRTSRTVGYTDCMDPASTYKTFVDWFRYWSINALKGKEEAIKSNSVYTQTEFDHNIESVSYAINACLAPVGWRNIGYSVAQEEMVAQHDEHGELPVELLSDGIRNMIGLVADIAFRATKLNPQLGSEASRRTPGVVLIDEVDMHLHPEWQQVVLKSLVNTFPEVQFIVTTHSPQVLTTVKMENIRLLGRDADGSWHASMPQQEIIGAESAMALNDIMRVNPIPPVEEAQWLADYTAKIESGTYEDTDGRILREKLLDLYGPSHPIMLDVDRLIRFQAFKLRKK